MTQHGSNWLGRSNVAFTESTGQTASPPKDNGQGPHGEARQRHWRQSRVRGLALAAANDSEPFMDRMNRLAAQLREQQAGGAGLHAAIAENLKTLGFGEREA